jgi:hypothetical protein
VAVPIDIQLAAPEVETRLALLRPRAVIVLRDSHSVTRNAAVRHGLTVIEAAAEECGRLGLCFDVPRTGPRRCLKILNQLPQLSFYRLREPPLLINICQITIRSSESCARSDGARTWSARFRMDNRRSTWLRRGLRHIAGTAWSTKRYLNTEPLKDQR